VHKNVTSLLHPLACSIAYLYMSISFYFCTEILARFHTVYLALNMAIAILHLHRLNF